MKVKFLSTTHAKIKTAPITPGQIISTKDVNGFYYDSVNGRNKLQPADDVLYCLISNDITNSDGVSGDLDFTVTSGSLGQDFNRTLCPYESLEFIFYDKTLQTQFASILHGLPYGEDGKYTYKWCSKCTASRDIDTTWIVNDGNIHKETVYAAVSLDTDTTFKIGSKTSVVETVENGVMTMSESDVSGDGRIALLKVVGRR